ncbi:NIPSNAP domain-containing protein [Mycolicibacterium sp. 141076]|uniref:NIPSNAP domain-containing protein n=1 Tax=Mycolicibacterium sp. 141076 TaxID=3090599 RepID=UPI00299F1B1C|nr:NIPSNAP domain-containing protein [Mycolicibacterium sp. 141076]MDX1878031.1 NIPSNAP domain-containing protein [Mycolicibacterium sp. 141076]
MELRTYTLADAAALESYVSTFWPRHIRTLRNYGIIVHGVWTDPESSEPRVIALVDYSGGDPGALAEIYRRSADFVDDHRHFDASLIVTTHTQTLQPIASSPLQ